MNLLKKKHHSQTAVLLLVSFLCIFPATLKAVDITQIVGRGDQAASFLDNELDEVSRQATIVNIRTALTGIDQTVSREWLLSVLCSIRPWTTGDTVTDTEFQADIAGVMADISDPHSSEFRYADCALINRQGQYRTTSINPLSNFRQEWCNRQNPIEQLQVLNNSYIERLDAISASIVQFNDGIDGFVSSAYETRQPSINGTRGNSYYPLRNQLRLLMLEAAVAVHFAQSGDIENARIRFNGIATSLTSFRDELNETQRRNGWRVYSDLSYYIALYSWLGDENGDQSEFSAIINSNPVIQDDDLAALIPGDIVADIRKKTKSSSPYFDFVFVERLLPGLQYGPAECEAWRGRSYNIVTLAKFTQYCANKSGPIAGHIYLVKFDVCMNDFEADDWTIQISSEKSDNEASAIVDALQDYSPNSKSDDTIPECNPILTELGLIDKPSSFSFSFERKNGAYYIVGEFCTSQIEWFRRNYIEIVGPRYPEPLYRRPRTF